MKNRFFALLLLLLPTTSSSPSFLRPGIMRSQQPVAHPGKDFALFFATDTYNTPSWRHLYAPVKDAREIAADLYDLYGFDTTVVVNPTKDQVRTKLSEFARQTYPSDGQLLVFFSGHGHYIDLVKDGFYIPNDGKASRDDPYGDSWLKYTDLRRTISGINCPHTLLVVDACFSGALDEGIIFGNMAEQVEPDRPGESEAIRKQRIKDLLRPRTRLFISSGVKDYVPDPSEFAAQFKAGLRSLKDNNDLLDIYGLYHTYLKNVSSNPVLGSFEQNQKASTFLFDYRNRRNVSLKENSAPLNDHQSWQAAKRQNNLAAYMDYKRQFPRGKFIQLAMEAIAQIEEEATWRDAESQNTEIVYRNFIARFPSSKYKVQAEAHIKRLVSLKSVTTMPDFMVSISGGVFEMGDLSGEGQSNEKPLHKVSLDDFYIGKTEVTVGEYLKFVDKTKSHYPEWLESGSIYNIKTGRDDLYEKLGAVLTDLKYPIVGVSWLDAIAYCNWLSEQKGLNKVYIISGDNVTTNWNANGYRLPTEAEWEYAARSGGKKENFAGFNKESDSYRYANYCDQNCKESWRTSNQNDNYAFTSPVGSFQANGLGVYDMTGNVWEWCSDWYDADYYKKSDKINPHGADSGVNRVFHGGSWHNLPADIRASYRNYGLETHRNNNIGFRLCRSAVDKGR